jgi:hypothetical protein
MAVEFAAVARELARQPDLPSTLAAIAVKAVETVEGAEFAAITVGREGDRYRTVGSTDELPLEVDRIQYDTEEGPCLDALRAQDRVFRTDDASAR